MIIKLQLKIDYKKSHSTLLLYKINKKIHNLIFNIILFNLKYINNLKKFKNVNNLKKFKM